MSTESSDLLEFEGWLIQVSGPGWLWHVKYLSANDTYAKPNVHQGGPHVSKAVLAAAFPRLEHRAELEENPDLVLPARVDSHGESLDLRLVWYNSRRLTGRPNGRDEARLTQWGGRDSAMLEPNATGSLVVMAFRTGSDTDAQELRIWRCRSIAEEDHLLERIPDVEPGRGRLVSPMGIEVDTGPEGGCALADDDIPHEWRELFPTGEMLVRWVVDRLPQRRELVDDRLLRRRECEYQVFRSVERYHSMPRIIAGFASVDAFVEYAGSLMNRRKSRGGRSLELHAREIFEEEHVAYSWTPRTEQNRSPDFIFPSIESYHDTRWPEGRLRMLAAKTTCKDRWRQILNEADRIETKHLLTLQEGISVAQHQEMRQANVRLVVPQRLLRAYPAEVAQDLMTFEQFIADVRASCGTSKDSLPSP